MRKQQRLYYIILVLCCIGFAAGLALYALRDNISFFFTPQQVHDLQKAGDARVRTGAVFRLGGLVKKGSLAKVDKNLTVRFTVTDTFSDINVEYKGILPDLFREGQGVVAHGSLDDQGLFTAAELLAKHDEKYTPPELKKEMQRVHDEGKARAQKAKKVTK